MSELDNIEYWEDMEIQKNAPRVYYVAKEFAKEINRIHNINGIYKVAIEEAIASLESGMAMGALCTLRDAISDDTKITIVQGEPDHEG